jgi:hypothetical protein
MVDDERLRVAASWRRQERGEDEENGRVSPEESSRPAPRVPWSHQHCLLGNAHFLQSAHQPSADLLSRRTSGCKHLASSVHGKECPFLGQA